MAQRINPTRPSFDVKNDDFPSLTRALNIFRREVAKLFNSEAAGNASISPDGNGNGTIAHGLGAAPSYVAVHISGDNVNGVDPESVDATNITVRIKDAAGADVTAGSFTIYWHARL